jgi:anti-sigma B factor antagonist
MSSLEIAMSSLEIRQEHDTDASAEVIAPQGEVDISNLSILDQVLTEVLQRQPRQLVVDLSGVSYIDSGGLSSLLRAGQRCSRQGGQLSLAASGRFVRRLFQMTGIDAILPHYDTVSAALGAGGTRETRVPSPAFSPSAPHAAAPDEPKVEGEPDRSGADGEPHEPTLPAARPQT